MPDSPEKLSERMLIEAKRVIEFFRSLESRDWEKQVYAEGSGWTSFQILCHFVFSEQSFNLLIKNILNGGPGAPEGFNIDSFNEKRVVQFAKTEVDELLHQFETAREANARLVSQMSFEDLGRKGRHPFLGIAPLEEIIKLIYRHNQIHIREIRKILQANSG